MIETHKIKNRERKGRDGVKEAMAVVQSVKSATIDDGFIGIGWREVGSHHRITVNRQGCIEVINPILKLHKSHSSQQVKIRILACAKLP